MYAGGGVPAFAGHAWNEVVLDGAWMPVDPSWNQMRVDATHIRYPVVASEEMAARSLLPRAVLRVESVNGEPVARTQHRPGEQR
jgi:transglutaminase-like putative cysteine protease